MKITHEEKKGKFDKLIEKFLSEVRGKRGVTTELCLELMDQSFHLGLSGANKNILKK